MKLSERIMTTLSGVLTLANGVAFAVIILCTLVGFFLLMKALLMTLLAVGGGR